MKTHRRGRGWSLALALVAYACGGGGEAADESAELASFQFTGVVEAVDSVSGMVTVHNDDVPGWMGAMSMGYRTDPPAQQAGLTVGSRIRATVYEGDFTTLHAVEVVPE